MTTQSLTREPTLTATLDAWARAGYRSNLIADGGALRCTQTGARYDPGELDVDSVARFEGSSNPSDQSILFALSRPGAGLRGVYLSNFSANIAPEEVGIVEQLEEPRS